MFDDASDKVSWGPNSTVDIALSGSVGDGPVVNAMLDVYSKDDEFLSNTVGNNLAGYNIEMRTKGKHYPVRIEASGGIDLVTGAPLDFTLQSTVVEPRNKAIANLNPYSTLAVNTARQMAGGLSTENLAMALDAVVNEFNMGLTSELSLDPMNTPVNDENFAEIVKASESLAEVIRRTAASLSAAGSPTSNQQVIDAISADLANGIFDGVGLASASRQVSATTLLVAAQVAIESMRNELIVHGQLVTPVLDSVILELSNGGALELTDSRPVTAYLINRAREGVDAAIALEWSSELDTVRTALAGLKPGISAADARQLLPANASASLSAPIAQLAAGSTAETDLVLTGVGASAEISVDNTAPEISGTPPTSVMQDTVYDFQPTATDVDGDPLSFSILNPPIWATFSTSTGELTGKPTAEHVGTYSNISIRVSDGQATRSLPTFSISVASAAGSTEPTNSAPVISGAPITSILQERPYQFTPTASDADDDSLSFSILNRPIWATFDSSTGTLSGTPTAADVGNYDDIVISVTDGQASASLPAFSIAVNAIALGSATLSWAAPTLNEDGTPLTDLAGYRVQHGQSPGSYSDSQTVMNPGVTTYVVDNLPSGTHYFVVSAINTTGMESDFSNEESIFIQ